MRKVLKIAICSLTAAALLAGCSEKSQDVNQTEAQTEAVTEAETDTGSEASSGQDSVTLGEYIGVSFTPVSTEVTDEQVDRKSTRLNSSH